ncbi:MAG TPA: YfhO family protein [Thermoanaerobaculia bacterium]|nr:YfhO family protein [Thermoanaerobaculia bacterium]
MNPALLLLLLLSSGGLLVRRREAGLAWCVCGLAAMALLAPALRLPDGIPSPAATLAYHPPWQSVANTAAGNPNLGDVASQIEPWLIFPRHELRAGRLPFWNPHQSSGAPFWSNGQGAPLFPLHLLFAVLPLQIGFVLLPWLRLVIGGCGAWALARELGLGRPAAMVAALVFPLSGMVTSFLLFPMGNTHALVPWVLLATERLAAGRSGPSGWPLLALTAGLQLLGGHPETPVFTGLLGLVYLLVRGSARPLATWAGFAAGWTVALAISAVHTLPLALLLPRTGKWLHWDPSAPISPFAEILALQARLILPDLFGNPADGTWWGPFNFAGTAVYAGAATLPLAAAGLALARRDRRWLAVAVLTLFAWLAAYPTPGVRHLLLALPVIQRALHHYLKFGVELGLGLLAAAGFDLWLRGRGKGLLAGAALVLPLLALIAWRFAPEWRAHGQAGVQTAWIAWIAGTAILLALSLLLPERRRQTVAPLIPLLLLADLWCAHARTNPGLSAARLYPVTGAVAFLQDQPGRVAGVGASLRPNAAMVYGLYDVRGDDPLKLQRYQEVYSRFGLADPVYFGPVEQWDHPWLDRLGVRWVVTGPSEAPVSNWRLAYSEKDARVYERPGALPLVRLPGGRVRVDRQEPGLWDIAWEGQGQLVVAETWDPGWRAWRDGRPVPVEPVDGLLLGVPAGPGAGRVELRYHSDGFAAGAVLSLLGLAGTGAGALWRRRRKVEAGRD